MIFSVCAVADRRERFPFHENFAARKIGVRVMLRLLIGSVGAALIALTAGCQDLNEQARSYFEEAQQLDQAGDQLGAIKALQQAIALRDDDPNYFLLLSAFEMRAGDPNSAFEASRRALELDAANVNALRVLANVALQVGRVDEANSAADRLLSLEPGSLIGLQIKGLVLLYQGKNEEAASYAQRLLTINPTDEAGTIILARVRAKEGQFEEAISLIDQSINQRRGTAALLITKINLYRAMSRPQDMLAAFAELDKVLENKPADLQLDRINLLYKIGRAQEARDFTQKLLADGSAGVREFDLLQRIWWEFDRVPFTRDTIKGAKNWIDPLALVAVGRYLLWQGEDQLTDDLYFNYRSEARPIGHSLHLRAVLNMNRIVDQATSELYGLLKRDPDEVDALLLRSTFEADRGDLGTAIATVQKALESDPNDPESYVRLAALHSRNGVKWRAQQVYEDGMKQLPQNFYLIDRYTQFLHELGDKQRAVSVTRSFARAMPSSVLAWTMMARQCDWAGDASCAGEAANGRQVAANLFRIDDPPGTAPDRSLLAKF